MDKIKAVIRIADLERQIAALPAGSITKKTVKGKVYYYHRWTEDRKRREKYIPKEEVDIFREQIQQRKALEIELKELKTTLPKATTPDVSIKSFAFTDGGTFISTRTFLMDRMSSIIPSAASASETNSNLPSGFGQLESIIVSSCFGRFRYSSSVMKGMKGWSSFMLVVKP